MAKSLTKTKSAAAKRVTKPLVATGAAARKVSAPTVPSRAGKAKVAAPREKPATKAKMATPTPVRKAAKAPPKAVAPVAAPRLAVVASSFSVGQRIAHRMFGPGVVLTVDGDKLEIKFKSVGVKWIAEEFVTRATR